MLTRREKLLVRPWQLRRYNNHRKKVLTALPVVDFGPPPSRTHVTLKLKKLQREDERRTKIEEDNFRLLQRMGAIMKKKRLDDRWEKKPPNFLRRVGTYHRTRSPSPSDATLLATPPAPLDTRKSRCIACNAHADKPDALPEERIPWEPPRKSPSSKRNGLAIADGRSVAKKTEDSRSRATSVKERERCCNAGGRRVAESTRRFFLLPVANARKGSDVAEEEAAPEKEIIVEQGPLHLALNFPIYVDVKVKSAAKGETFIQRGYCTCGALDNRTSTRTTKREALTRKNVE